VTRFSLAGTLVTLALVFAPAGGVPGAEPSRAEVERRLASTDYIDALRELGPAVLPVLARIYSSAGPDRRARVANAFYGLGWESEAAREALSADLTTDHERLRLSVQWAIGRVSNDDDVVERLLTILRTDPNELFSEKAACALAHDQVHLTEEQKVLLYAGLIETLRSPVGHVRRDAIRALKIHTGQRRGFQPWGDAEERERAVRGWERWLREYESEL
jgi:HEAT repeat protein